MPRRTSALEQLIQLGETTVDEATTDQEVLAWVITRSILATFPSPGQAGVANDALADITAYVDAHVPSHLRESVKEKIVKVSLAAEPYPRGLPEINVLPLLGATPRELQPIRPPRRATSRERSRRNEPRWPGIAGRITTTVLLAFCGMQAAKEMGIFPGSAFDAIPLGMRNTYVPLTEFELLPLQGFTNLDIDFDTLALPPTWTNSSEPPPKVTARDASSGQFSLEFSGLNANEQSWVKFVSPIYGELSFMYLSALSDTTQFEVLVNNEVVFSIQAGLGWQEFNGYFVGPGDVIELRTSAGEEDMGYNASILVDNVKIEDSPEAEAVVRQREAITSQAIQSTAPEQEVPIEPVQADPVVIFSGESEAVGAALRSSNLENGVPKVILDEESGKYVIEFQGIENNQESSYSFTAPVSGRLAITWRVSSEQIFDRLELHVNGQTVSNISGETLWHVDYLDVNQGDQVDITYIKDESYSNKIDTGLVRDIRIIPFQAVQAAEQSSEGIIEPLAGQTTDTLFVQGIFPAWMTVQSRVYNYSPIISTNSAAEGKNFTVEFRGYGDPAPNTLVFIAQNSGVMTVQWRLRAPNGDKLYIMINGEIVEVLENMEELAKNPLTWETATLFVEKGQEVKIGLLDNVDELSGQSLGVIGGIDLP